MASYEKRNIMRQHQWRGGIMKASSVSKQNSINGVAQ